MNTRSRFFGPTFALLVLLAAVGACQPSDPGGSGSGGKGSGGSGSGGSGSGGSGSCGSGSGGSSSGNTKATFANVRLIVDFAPCSGSGCHEAGGEMPNLYGTSDSDLYKTLTTFKSTKCGGFVLVKPCAPKESAFYLAQLSGDMCKSTAASHDVLSRMPFGCSDQTCTPPENLDGLRDWIADGAKGP